MHPGMNDSSQEAAPAAGLPLFVDLDGTLVKTDVFGEGLLSLTRRAPWKLLLLPVWFANGRSFAKAMVHRHSSIAVERLPYNTQLIEHLREGKARGRAIHLATAAHRSVARRVARHLNLFDSVIASDARSNIKGRRKLQKIASLQQGAPFAYAGDSSADRPLWDAAQQCIFVDAPAADVALAREKGKIEMVVATPNASWLGLLKALRPHQWVKNFLLVVPLLTAHLYLDGAAVADAFLAFSAFCMCASSLYVVNDLLDIEDDRLHPTKKSRPFAAGTASIGAGIALAPMLFLSGLALSLTLLPGLFVAILVAYCATSLTYSLWLKRISTVDVFALAGLYTVRVIAGAAAIGVASSYWLLAFSLFMFLSLAYVKRYTELDRLKETGGDRLSGRGYAAVDLETTFVLGAVAGGLAALVMALYINSPDVKVHYPSPQYLWAVCPAILYWNNRVWVGVRRGKIHDDPVLFALKDRVSMAVGAFCIASIAAARFLPA